MFMTRTNIHHRHSVEWCSRHRHRSHCNKDRARAHTTMPQYSCFLATIFISQVRWLFNLFCFHLSWIFSHSFSLVVQFPFVHSVVARRKYRVPSVQQLQLQFAVRSDAIAEAHTFCCIYESSSTRSNAVALSVCLLNSDRCCHFFFAFFFVLGHTSAHAPNVNEIHLLVACSCYFNVRASFTREFYLNFFSFVFRFVLLDAFGFYDFVAKVCCDRLKYLFATFSHLSSDEMGANATIFIWLVSLMRYGIVPLLISRAITVGGRACCR